MPSTTQKKKVISVVNKRSSSANVRTTKTGRKYSVSTKPLNKRNISVMIVPVNDTFKKKSLSPKTMVTKSGRKYNVWTQAKSSKSGLVYAIQQILPGSRPPMSK